MLQNAFVGIDVAFAKGKRLPVVVAVREEGRLAPLPLRNERSCLPPRGRGNGAAIDPAEVDAFASETVAYLTAIARRFGLRFRRIAIDAPKAPCAPSMTRRAAERAMDAQEISCFPTPTSDAFETIRVKVRRHLGDGGAVSRLPHANQLWMLVGFQLFERLEALAECLEVFPQAIAWSLGASSQHKSKVAGLTQQLVSASRHTGWPQRADLTELRDVSFGSGHDKLDAYLSAWVASLAEEDRIPLGELPDDVIWVPRLKGVASPSTDGRSRTSNVALALEELFAVQDKLRKLGVLRSQRLVTDLGEWVGMIVANAERSPSRTERGWDLRKGDRRIQVKAHAKAASNTARHTDLPYEETEFDELMLVIFSERYQLRAVYRIPVQAVRRIAPFDGKKRVVRWSAAEPWRMQDLPEELHPIRER